MEIKSCTNCLMDTTDSAISFNENGVCNYCTDYEISYANGYFGNQVVVKEDYSYQFNKLIETVKRYKSSRSKYDCLIGISGGVDSCYVVYLMKKHKINPLILHIDTGWNSELAVSNIQKTVEYSGFDFFTEIVDWDEMKALQNAYLKSGISNQDVPQDQIIFKTLYDYARKYKISTFVTGSNIATEYVNPKSWHRGSALDTRSLKYIYKTYGSGKKLRKYKLMSFIEYYILIPFIYRIRTVRPLNYINYDRNEAIKTMSNEFGWTNYGYKHGESLFTKLFQNYYLPKRYGFDKRKPHLSSMILSGQITREEALSVLNEDLYDKGELQKDIKYFCKKLDLDQNEFNDLLKLPLKYHDDFPNNTKLIVFVTKLKNLLLNRLNIRITVNQ